MPANIVDTNDIDCLADLIRLAIDAPNHRVSKSELEVLSPLSRVRQHIDEMVVKMQSTFRLGRDFIPPTERLRRANQLIEEAQTISAKLDLLPKLGRMLVSRPAGAPKLSGATKLLLDLATPLAELRLAITKLEEDNDRFAARQAGH